MTEEEIWKGAHSWADLIYGPNTRRKWSVVPTTEWQELAIHRRLRNAFAEAERERERLAREAIEGAAS